MARRHSSALKFAPPVTLVALVAVLALTASGWGPPGAWLTTHTPLALQRAAQGVFQSVVSSMPIRGQTASVATITPSPELPAVPGAPTSYQLAISANANIAEPGSGYDTNFPLFSATDDASGTYRDPYYATLCGPGAVSVALSYWPPAPDRDTSASITDPLLGSATTPTSTTTTIWSDWDLDGVYRMRAYMLRLAYQVRAPGWSQSGMLPQSYLQSGQLGGATLQVVNDTLNWEASGENTRDWRGYFYHIQWNNAFYHDQRHYPMNLYTALHADIVNDLTRYHTPVIVELTAGYLPNWREANPVNHFIAIIGYDDAAGTYTYLDTCKEYSGCNTGGADAPSLHSADQLQLSAGVAHIATSASTGDGGWVW